MTTVVLTGVVIGGEETPIKFEIIHLRDALGGFKPSYLAIRSPQDWSKEWLRSVEDSGTQSTSTRAPPSPDVDFTKHTLLVAYNGVKMSGTNYIAFTSVVDEGPYVKVNIETHSSGDCPRTENISYSYATALIPRTEKPIRFDVLDKTCKAGGGWTSSVTHY